jgi:hypothetical protein
MDMMQLTRSMILGSTLLVGSLWTATPSQAAGSAAIHITVTSKQRSVAAPDRVTWTVRMTNLTGQTLSVLRLSESVDFDGLPGFGGTGPFTSAGCGGAAGTRYCWLPALQPGATISGSGFADVPLRLDPTGSSTVGSLLKTEEVVVSKAGLNLSNVARFAVRVTRTSLPFTGVPVLRLAMTGLLSVAAGGVLLRSGHRPKRRQALT